MIMAARETTEKDHRERLNKVLVYIQENSDQKLTLDRLAAVASFSAFHFHRIFAACVGETVSGYVRRIRLDRAAMKIYFTDEPITSIALAAEYDTPAAFAKAFKQRFGRSPTEYKKVKRREQLPALKSIPDRTYREGSVSDMKPEIRMIPEEKVMFVRKTGPYAKAAGEAWGALMKFAYSHRLMNKETKGIGISHDSPDITPEDNIRYDACITVAGPVKPEGEVGVQKIGGGKYAVFLHKGPYEKFGETYNAIFTRWLPEAGAKLREAPCFEVYLNRDPRRTRPEKLRTEIFIPIQ
jgi:AraC family transcriptional regulator